VERGAVAYIDDIMANNDVVRNERVLGLLARYGLDAKPPEGLAGGRVLGLREYCEGTSTAKERVIALAARQPAGRRTFRCHVAAGVLALLAGSWSVIALRSGFTGMQLH